MASPVVKEFRCAAHGDFESTVDKCPHGCIGTVSRVFLTPAAFRSNRTGRIDKRVEDLAAAHGLTDISNRGGRAAIREKPGAAQERADMAKLISERYGNGWGKVGKGGAPAALAQYRAPASNALEEVRPALTPKAVHRIQDPQGLKLTADMVKRA